MAIRGRPKTKKANKPATNDSPIIEQKVNNVSNDLFDFVDMFNRACVNNQQDLFDVIYNEISMDSFIFASDQDFMAAIVNNIKIFTEKQHILDSQSEISIIHNHNSYYQCLRILLALVDKSLCLDKLLESQDNEIIEDLIVYLCDLMKIDNEYRTQVRIYIMI